MCYSTKQYMRAWRNWQFQTERRRWRMQRRSERRRNTSIGVAVYGNAETRMLQESRGARLLPKKFQK